MDINFIRDYMKLSIPSPYFLKLGIVVPGYNAYTLEYGMLITPSYRYMRGIGDYRMSPWKFRIRPRPMNEILRKTPQFGDIVIEYDGNTFSHK